MKPNSNPQTSPKTSAPKRPRQLPRPVAWKLLAALAVLCLAAVACGGDSGNSASNVSVQNPPSQTGDDTDTDDDTQSPTNESPTPTNSASQNPGSTDQNPDSHSPSPENPTDPETTPPTTAADETGQPTPTTAQITYDSVLPDVNVLRVSTGETVNLASLAPASTPLIIWFWAPH